jgi:hypothetical protein
MSVIEKLTEGIRERSLANEGEALLSKWERTGLLEGLSENRRSTMARLLENQAGQLLKEASSMAGGDVEGFASVAFPIVRRVFGNLLAQDLVSVQPMSLPSGLIFFLDFTYAPQADNRLGALKGDSIYGQGRVAKGILSGANLVDANEEKGFYSLNNGYSSPTGSASSTIVPSESGTYGIQYHQASREPLNKILRNDPHFVSGTTTFVVGNVNKDVFARLNDDDFVAIMPSTGSYLAGPEGGRVACPVIRRLTDFSGTSTTVLRFVVASPSANAANVTATQLATAVNNAVTITWPRKDLFQGGSAAFGSVVGASPWQLENQTAIPEIDIKVDSHAVTATTKKLKAKWTPELAQDLNAYHNLDAEVELTSVLSEHIALEIDQEILNDLVQGGTGGLLFWSRNPGRFVNRDDGTDITNSLYPDFTGTVSEWYETLLETINDLSARIHRKTLRGGANFVVTSPEVASILEMTSGFRADVVVDGDKGSWGAKKVGSISNKMEVMIDPYFPRNILLVGRRGKSFLESGYVYAPYVPLQVTPTIFGPEDFVPRKGVMTRYAKQMVRPDMYGLVVCQNLVD